MSDDQQEETVVHYLTPDRTLLLREDGILVERVPDIEAQEPADEDLPPVLSVAFGRALASLSVNRSDDQYLPPQQYAQQELADRVRKVFEKMPMASEFYEFAFALGDVFGWSTTADPLLAQVQMIDRLMHDYFNRVDQQVFAAWSAIRLAMLADVQAQAGAAMETIRSIVENQADLSAPLTVAMLAHADRDSKVAVKAFTSGLESGYWTRPFSEGAVGLQEWGNKFDDRAPVFGDRTVWDPRLVLPTLLYALAVRVMVLKALHSEPRQYCREIRETVQFLLSVQFQWQAGIRRKHRLSTFEMRSGAGFSVRPFAAGAVDVYTGSHHVIDVDADAENLFHALGYSDGPLPARVPLLDPEFVCPDITELEIEHRFETEYRPILAKQADFSFTRLRWQTGLHSFSDTVKSLGEICAGIARPSGITRAYRNGMKLINEHAIGLPGGNRDAQHRAELASGLTRLLHPPQELGTSHAMRNRFEIYTALHEDRGTLSSDLRTLVTSQLIKAGVPTQPDGFAFAAWEDIGTERASGTLHGAQVTVEGPGTGGTTDGTFTLFAAPHFSPPLPASDVVSLTSLAGSSFRLRFGAPVRDVLLHLASVASSITFPPGTPVVRVSGTPTFSLSGTTVTGVVAGSLDSGGTLRINGTVTELEFTADPVFSDGTIPDGFYLQVGALPS
ncbi:hypothetical protein ACWGJT_03780 [Streptomyces xantholiticus]